MTADDRTKHTRSYSCPNSGCSGTYDRKRIAFTQKRQSSLFSGQVVGHLVWYAYLIDASETRQPHPSWVSLYLFSAMAFRLRFTAFPLDDRLNLHCGLLICWCMHCAMYYALRKAYFEISVVSIFYHVAERLVINCDGLPRFEDSTQWVPAPRQNLWCFFENLNQRRFAIEEMASQRLFLVKHYRDRFYHQSHLDIVSQPNFSFGKRRCCAIPRSLLGSVKMGHVDPCDD